MRGLDLCYVEFDPKPRPLRHGYLTADDLERLARESRIAFLWWY